jgi:transposase InsO family protein
VSRSGYYKWLKQKIMTPLPSLEEAVHVAKVYEEGRGVYGYPRVYRGLKMQGINMRNLGLKGAKKRFRPQTTNSNHDGPIAPRIFNGKEQTNKSWVSDITYIKTATDWSYLAVVMNVKTRKILGWSFKEHLKSSLVIEAIKDACEEKTQEEVILHSDRGVQYASSETIEVIKQFGLTRSMSRRGNCYDNAFAESFFSSLKKELLGEVNFNDHYEAKMAIADYINWYNTKRLHSSLGYLSPLMYEEKVA